MALRSSPAEKNPGRPARTSAAGGSAATPSKAATSSSSRSRSSALAGGRSTASTVTPSRSVVVRKGIAGSLRERQRELLLKAAAALRGDVERARALVAAHPRERQQAAR